MTAAMVACGGTDNTAIGQGGLSSSKATPDCSADGACGPALGAPAVECSDGSIGGNTGRCIASGDTCAWEMRECPDAGPTDPCDGVTLPACARECETFPMEGACTSGDQCRMAGSTIGDECSCTGGAWACSPHPPLGLGCNQVCRPAPSTDPCDGVKLPACPKECAAFPMTGKCTPGDQCRAQGSKIGDECTCLGDGSWGCAVHPPLGMGCNLVCK